MCCHVLFLLPLSVLLLALFLSLIQFDFNHLLYFFGLYLSVIIAFVLILSFAVFMSLTCLLNLVACFHDSNLLLSSFQAGRAMTGRDETKPSSTQPPAGQSLLTAKGTSGTFFWKACQEGSGRDE